jgi:hypothetical protein
MPGPCSCTSGSVHLCPAEAAGGGSCAQAGYAGDPAVQQVHSVPPGSGVSWASQSCTPMHVSSTWCLGTLSAGQHMKFLCRSGMLLVGHRRHQLRQVTTPACAYCRSCSDATPAHARPAVLCLQGAEGGLSFIWQSLTSVLGVATVAELRELPADHQRLLVHPRGC